MAPFTRLQQRRRSAVLLSLSLLLPPAAQAQIAEVVRPNAQGDFLTILASGERGSVPQRFWLVVDRDPRGLLCRDEQGRARIALRNGSVLELEQSQRQPLLIQGKPTLLVAIKPVDILYDARFSQRGQAAICRVRANSAFLAPIQAGSLEQLRLRP